MHPLSQALADTYVRCFWSADQDITWVASEEERSLWLTPNTLLLGRIDARGFTSDGHHFFAEFKTLSNYRGRYIEDEKIKWRTDPQALTYGVLVPDCDRFTVRWAIKPDDRGKQQPRCAFEWYTYTLAEVEHWKSQLIEIADEIRGWRKRAPDGPWRTNFGACFRYGLKYPCPFFARCSKQEWAKSMGAPRTPHLASERKLRESLDSKPDSLVVLDASRVSDYLECPESYRRKWEGEGFSETSEALVIGTDFHAAVSTHIKAMIKEPINAK